MKSMLDAALWYAKKGYSVVPVGKSKIPFKGIEWKQFQTEKANEDQIHKWWSKWPNANIAVVTGKISNLTVVDADSPDGKDALEDLFIPEHLTVPISKTPREGGGWHYFFKYVPGIRNSQKGEHPIVTDCDIRSEGGYVVVPPSANGNGKQYEWLEDLHLGKVTPATMPEDLSATILQGQSQGISLTHKIDIDPLVNARTPTRSKTDANEKDQLSTPVYQCPPVSTLIPCGERDKSIFHLANHLVKGNMPLDNIRYFLELFINNCCEQGKEPYSEKNIEIKLNSALNRQKNRDRNITEEVREWALSTFGNFLSTEIHQCLLLSTRNEKKICSKVLSQLVEAGDIVRTGKKNAQFRRVDKEAPKIDILNAKTAYVDIKLPLDLHEYFRPMEKNIIVIAGTQDVGKTAFMLNIAKLNMNRGMDIRYCTSEMGGSELRSRLDLFEPEVPIRDWVNVDFRERSTNFVDVILPDGLNIIDYLEIPTEFWKVGELLTEIHGQLQKGIAIVALQKGFKQDLGRGAEFSLEKPRLYVTLTANPPEGNVAKIVKCKNWANSEINPNNRECVFNVIKGTNIRQVVPWGLPEKMMRGKK